MDKPTKTTVPEILAREEFVREYLSRNPNKSNTEALQEWNREKSRRTEYTSGFSGRISLGNLPRDTQRNIISRIPGATYSILPTAQRSGINISTKNLCLSPVSVGEFRKFILEGVMDVIDGEKSTFEVSFITGYGIGETITSRGGEDANYDKLYPNLDERVKEIRQIYRGNRALPIIFEMTFIALGTGNSKQYSEETSKHITPRKYIYVKYNNLAARIVRHKSLFPTFQFRVMYPNLDVGIKLPSSHAYLVRKTEIESFVTDTLSDNSLFPDYPNVTCNLSTAEDIFFSRPICKDVSIKDFLEKGYNWEKLAADIVKPVISKDVTYDKSKTLFIWHLINFTDISEEDDIRMFIRNNRKNRFQRIPNDPIIQEFYDYYKNLKEQRYRQRYPVKVKEEEEEEEEEENN